MPATYKLRLRSLLQSFKRGEINLDQLYASRRAILHEVEHLNPFRG